MVSPSRIGSLNRSLSFSLSEDCSDKPKEEEKEGAGTWSVHSCWAWRKTKLCAGRGNADRMRNPADRVPALGGVNPE